MDTPCRLDRREKKIIQANTGESIHIPSASGGVAPPDAEGEEHTDAIAGNLYFPPVKPAGDKKNNLLNAYLKTLRNAQNVKFQRLS